MISENLIFPLKNFGSNSNCDFAAENMNSMTRKKLEVLPPPNAPCYCHLCGLQNLIEKEATRRSILYLKY